MNDEREWINLGHKWMNGEREWINLGHKHVGTAFDREQLPNVCSKSGFKTFLMEKKKGVVITTGRMES